MPDLISLGALIVSSVATTTLGANILYLGTMALGYAGLAAGAYFLQSALTPKPAVPKAEDGSYNLKQQVPPLSYVLGRVKKGGDYVFLEERSGTAHHITVMAAHRVNRFLAHYLHDDKVTLSTVGGTTGVVTSPSHYHLHGGRNVRILTRPGLRASTAYSQVTSVFPEIWTADHRGDGLASIWMRVNSVSQKNHMTIYPQNMPEHSAAIEGALLYDFRKDSTKPGGSGSHRTGNPDSWSYAENLALMRLWHLCSPVGGKLNYTDMYVPEWIDAANVCDETVINRAGEEEPRYHGGFWFRANNSPTDVGLIMDQAAELVVYERPDGLVGVHPGKFVEPDIRLTQDDILSVQFDANERDASTVLAVRGRFTDTERDFVVADAAIYGNPYQADDDTERTKTLENAALQRHNHTQRLQKITYLRSNAPRVNVTAHYEPAENVPYRRFVRVHLPPKMEEAIVEITATPTISLRNLTVSFSGIVVPPTLYSFIASVEEGAPPARPDIIAGDGVPVPEGFDVVIRTEVVAGGATAAFALASWTYVSEVLTYELQWEPTDASEPAQSIISQPEKADVRSFYLVDGKQYRFRLRAIDGGGGFSDWTDYETRTATADPVAPAAVTGTSLVGGVGQVTFNWTAPNSANYFAARLYLNTTDTMTGATLVGTEYGAPAAPDSRIINGLSAETYYGWVSAINASGVSAAAVPTGPATVT